MFPLYYRRLTVALITFLFLWVISSLIDRRHDNRIPDNSLTMSSFSASPLPLTLPMYFDRDHHLGRPRFTIALFQPMDPMFSYNGVDYKCNENETIRVKSVTTASAVNDAQVVVLGYPGLTEEHWIDLQHHRNWSQIWIMSSGESALSRGYANPPPQFRHSSYNWSFFFHSSADISVPFGQFIHFKRNTWDSGVQQNFTYKLRQKSKMIAWMSSRHCRGLSWNRTLFVQRLSDLVPVDMYGKCGSLSCSVNPNDECLDTLRQYKFYLALENSCCSEYITEKFWNPLVSYEAVPIVIGAAREEYQKLAPPMSFIHADDFGSLDELARFIEIVAKDEILYQSYFKWRSFGQVTIYSAAERKPCFREGACRLHHFYNEFLEAKTKESRQSFDPYGSSWFGNCFRCGRQRWIQDFIFKPNLRNYESKLASITGTNVKVRDA